MSVPLLVTRPAEPDGRTVQRFVAAGFTVTHVPCIEIAPPPDAGAFERAARAAHAADWVILTSQNAVTKLAAFGPALPHIAAIGPETARAVQRELGREADLVASEHRAERLAAELLAVLAPSQRVVMFRAERGRDLLPDALRRAGHAVDLVVAYTVRPAAAEALPLQKWLRSAPAEAVVVLASSLTVDAFFELGGPLARRPLRFACISPVTAARLGAHGAAAAVVAREHTLAGLVRALADVN